MLSLLVACSAVLAAQPASARIFEYLYIEANEGGAAGGHAGVRFGERVYHFQYQGGLVRLRREKWGRYLHRYALETNRPIHATRIEVSDETWRLLRGHFARRHLAQSTQLAWRSGLQRERELLESWLQRARPGRERGRPDAVQREEIPAAGYFELDDGGPSGESRVLRELRDRVLAERGEGFFDRRMAALQHEVLSLRPDDLLQPPTTLQTGLAPPSGYGFAAGYRDAVGAGVALDVLRAARSLAPDAMLAPDDDEFALLAEERPALEALHDRLIDELARLVVSRRPDWGVPLLVGMARLAALDRTLESGRWVVLDVIADDATRVEHRGHETRERALRDLARDMAAVVELERRRLISAPVAGEREYAAVEDALNRRIELQRAIRSGQPIRLAGALLVPRRMAPASELPIPAAPPGELERALERNRASRRAFDAELRRLYRYNLIRHNCVSELFHAINEALGDSPAESQRRLGGYVDPEAGLTFIPVVSSRVVQRSYRVVGHEVLPSYREVRLRELRGYENRFAVAVRESNTLTARSYERSPEDSLFLFFTDGSVWPRPLFGVANLAAALGQSIFGLVKLPFERRTLEAGLRGAAVSLPELFFFNIRKGSNEYVPPSLEPAVTLPAQAPQASPPPRQPPEV